VARRALVVAAVLVAVLLAVLLAAGCTSSPSVTAVVGRPAPQFSTFDLAGSPVRLASVHGPVLLNFWASWCTPCRVEFPMLASVRGATVLGVVFRDSRDDAAAFMRDRHATWPGLIDPKHQIADAYGVHPKPGIPVTFAIDGSGVVRAKHLGPLQPADLMALLRSVGVSGAP
jgi:cytochrome c biogenesis protein CcmG/thiol:disulfide interchange protein DsbE